MKTKRNMKIIIIVILNLVLFYSCLMDYKERAYPVRNCTNDTLLINFTSLDTLDNGLFFPEDSILLAPEDTISVFLHGEKVIMWSQCFALPDSSVFIGFPAMFYHIRDTLYIYAIKWQVAKKYSIEEIRAKKLYDRRTVTKKDFHDLVYDYKIEK